MTIKTVGFGGTGSSSYATLSTLIREFAPERYEQAINQAAPLIASKLLQKENVPDDEWLHTVFGGAFSSTALVRDGGRLPQGEGKVPFILREQPANVVSMLTMGRRAAKAKLKGNKLAQVFDSALQEASDDCARTLARSLHGSGVNPAAAATWSGTAADSTVDVTFTDVSMFRPGMAVDFIDASASLAYVVRVTDVAPGAVGSASDAVGGTVSFINDVPDPSTGSVVALGATAVATGDSFRLRGETAGFGGSSTTIDNALNTFTDMAGTGSLHGQTAAAVPGWRGHTKALSGPYSQEAVVQFMGRMHTQGGMSPNVAVCAPTLAAAHKAYVGETGSAFGLIAGQQASRTMVVDNSADKFGNIFEDDGLRVGGAKIIQDPNHPAASMTLFHNAKTKLAVWEEMGPAEEAGDPTLLGRTFFDVGAQIEGGYNLVTYARRTVGVITGITDL